MGEQLDAELLALDVTTTELAVAVRDASGREDYAATPMRGGHAWRGDTAFPAFDLAELPRMIGELLDTLASRGWKFQGPSAGPRYVSVSCRQHDLVVLDRQGVPLLPALSWQCNAAADDVRELRKLGVEAVVGTIEPRFVLPKLRCVLRLDAGLANRIGTVFMTGDWIAHALTGERSLSTSDALSNGLLEQRSRQLAAKVLETAGFAAHWFPVPVQSGREVGVIRPPRSDSPDAWGPVQERLQGWHFVAGLGDNHASAVGCGMRDDHRTLVVSAGTSGTINLSCPADAVLPADGRALRFEFYGDSLLLLLMLGDCGAWYNRFLDHFARGYRDSLDELNVLALAADVAQIRRVLHDEGQHAECYPPQWSGASLGDQVAWTQFSIALELLLRVKRMLDEVRGAGVPGVETFVLTGGLSQSAFFRQVFHAGIQLLAPGKAVRVSGRTGPLRYKTSASGALVNAELPRFEGQLGKLHATGERFPLVACEPAGAVEGANLRYLLQSCGL